MASSQEKSSRSYPRARDSFVRSSDQRMKGVLLPRSREHKYRGHSPILYFRSVYTRGVIGYFHSSLSDARYPAAKWPSHPVPLAQNVLSLPRRNHRGRKARDELKAPMRVKVSRSVRIDNLHRISQGACVSFFHGIPLIN